MKNICGKECIVFNVTVCINIMIDHILELKGKTERDHNKIANPNLNLLAQKISGFDRYVLLNIVSQWNNR